jgi:hypothetical protein
VLVDDDAAMVRALADLARNPVRRRCILEHNVRVPPECDWPVVVSRFDEVYAAPAARARSGAPVWRTLRPQWKHGLADC